MDHRQIVVYTRISDDKTGQELGVERQAEDCHALAVRRGAEAPETFQDNDRSAKKAGTRPEFNRLLQAVSEGAVGTIVAWSWDRLTRNRRETVQLIEACQEHNVLISLVKGSDIDCSTAAGRLVADVLASVARNEIDQKSERQVRAYRQAAEAGKPHFVARPYGYTRQGDLVVEEAEVLREAAEHFLRGWSTAEIRDWLNREGFPSATGKQWTRRVIRDHLLSKRNAGIRVYKGEEFPGTWTPIWSVETHERLVAEWKRRDIKVGRSNARRYLLTGFLYCGKCGAKMAGGQHNDRGGEPVRDKYRCYRSETNKGCGNLMRVAETLDHFVTEALLYRLDSPEMQQVIMSNEANAEQIEPLRAEADLLRGRLESLLDDYTDGTLTKPEYQRAKARVTANLDRLEREIEGLYSSQQARALLSAGDKLREVWDVESLGWRRKLVGLVIEKIVVHPDRSRTIYEIDGKRYKFNPEAIEVIWKA